MRIVVLSWVIALALGAAPAKTAKPAAVAAPGSSRGVALLPTVGLKAADGYSPKPEVVAEAWAALRAALPRSTLTGAAWVFGSPSPTLEESARVLSTLRAKPIPAAVDALLAQAAAAKAEFAYAKQAQLLKEAIAALGKDLQDAKQLEALLDAEIALASAYLDNNERSFAEAEFTKVVRMRPDTDLDLRDYAPNVVDLFNQVKLRVLAEPTADIDVDVKPHGALVVLNGFVVGQSPKTLAVRKGDYLIQVVAPGYKPFGRVITVTATGGVRLDDQMDREQTQLIADGILAGLGADGAAAPLAPQVQALRGGIEADGVVLSGVTEVDGGFALVVVLVGPALRRVVATYAATGNEVERAALAALEALAGPAKSTDYDLVSGGAPPLSVQRLRLDFAARLLGLSGAPVRPEVSPALFGALGPAFVPPAKSRCEQDDPPTYCSVWPWIVAGTALVGAGVGTYFLLAGGDDSPRRREIDLRILAPAPSVGAGQP